VVFTGIGALGWLPSISRWANVVSALLKPGGKLFVREAHPMLWTIDDVVSGSNPVEKLSVAFPYFEDGRPIMASKGLAYVDNEGHQNETSEPAKPPALPTIEFNHGLGEIIQSLLEAGLRITMVEEHQSVPWNALPGRMERIEGEEGAGVAEWRMKRAEHRGMVPLSYTMQAVKDM
jgi:hypothetical protein